MKGKPWNGFPNPHYKLINIILKAGKNQTKTFNFYNFAFRGAFHGRIMGALSIAKNPSFITTPLIIFSKF